jgi:branched-chain amino acid transport system permease protein
MKKRSGIVRGILFGVVGCVLLLFPSFAQNRYQIHIINMVGIYILLSLGLNLAMGYAGQFNLAIGALWGVGAYTAAILNTRLGIPFWLNLPAAMIVTAIIGGFVGLPSL